MLTPWFVPVFLFVLANHPSFGHAQSCVLGKVDLRPIVSTTFVVTTNSTQQATPQGTLSFSLSLCTPTRQVLPSLTPCGVPGYVLIHNGSVCVHSMSDWAVPTLISTNVNNQTGVVAKLQSMGSPADAINVTMLCSLTGTSGKAIMHEPALYETVNVVGTNSTRRIYSVTLSSYDACPLDPLFCDGTSILCRDQAKSCKNNVCVDMSCLTLTRVATQAAAPADVVTTVKVTDCGGTPIPLLTASDFEIALDGTKIYDPIIKQPEAESLVEQVPSVDSVVVSTVLLDVSKSSHATEGMIGMKNAATAFVQSTVISKQHYVALYSFDGSSEIQLVHGYSKNIVSLSLAISKLNLSTSADAGSTNLYGAYILGAEEAARSLAYFGTISSSVVGSVVLFTDGYDTAGRVSRAASLTRVSVIRAKFSLSAFAVTTDVSDINTVFLSEAVGSVNVYDGKTSLSPVFLDIARRQSLQSNNTYIVGVCAPFRTGRHSVTISLNSTRYLNAPSTTWFFDASTYGGGCNSMSLTKYVPAPSNVTADSLNTTNVLTKVSLNIDSAYYFSFSNTIANAFQVLVTPATATLYVAQQELMNCSVVGKYCKIATLVGDLSTAVLVYTPPRVAVYEFMVVPGMDNSNITVMTRPTTQRTPIPLAPTRTSAAVFPVAAPTPSPRRVFYGPFDHKALLALGIVFSVCTSVAMLAIIGVFWQRVRNAERNQSALQEKEESLLEMPSKDSKTYTLPNPYRQLQPLVEKGVDEPGLMQEPTFYIDYAGAAALQPPKRLWSPSQERSQREGVSRGRSLVQNLVMTPLDQ